MYINNNKKKWHIKAPNSILYLGNLAFAKLVTEGHKKERESK